jgi:hypothetical protein
LESLGVTIRVPAGARVTKITGGGLPVYGIDDGMDPPRFRFQLQPLVSSLPRPTPELQIEQYLASAQEKGQTFRTLRNEARTIGGQPARILYTATDLGEGVTAIQGWLVIQLGEFDFIVATVISSAVDFPSADPLLERCFATIGFEGLRELATARNARIEAGARLLASITPERVRQVADGSWRLFRTTRPDASGAMVEVGYYEVQASPGNMEDASSSADVQRDEKRATASEPTGMVVTVRGRSVIDATLKRVADTDARFWVSWDRGAEAWTVRVTERGGGPVRTYGQMGLRTAQDVGNPKPKLIVVDSDADQRTRNERRWTIPEGAYLSQAEQLVLGRLIPDGATPTGDISYYCFDARTSRMPQRVESWTRSGDGTWLAVTRPGIDEDPEVMSHDAKGWRKRRTEPDGTVTEATDLESIRRAWVSKGLPLR